MTNASKSSGGPMWFAISVFQSFTIRLSRRSFRASSHAARCPRLAPAIVSAPSASAAGTIFCRAWCSSGSYPRSARACFKSTIFR